MSKPAGGSAGTLKVGGDDRSTKSPIEKQFLETPFTGDIKYLPLLQKLTRQQMTTENRRTVVFLKNEGNDHSKPEKLRAPIPRQPEDLIIPDGTDPNMSLQMTVENAKELSVYQTQLMDSSKLQMTLDLGYKKSLSEYEENLAKGWTWLRTYVDASHLETIIATLETDNSQEVFAELFKCDAKAMELSEGMEHKRKVARFHALTFFLPTTVNGPAMNSNSMVRFISKVLEFQAEAKISDEVVVTKLLSQFSGITYVAEEEIRRPMFDILKIAGFKGEVKLTDLTEQLKTAFSEYVAIVAFTGGKVTHISTPARKRVELDGKLRMEEYYQQYGDDHVRDATTLICGTVNAVMQKDKSSKTKGEAGKQSFPKKCFHCLGHYHLLSECPSESCAACKSLGANPHKGKCPLFKFYLRHYLDHGKLPTGKEWILKYKVPQALYELCFKGKYPGTKDPDRQPTKDHSSDDRQSSKGKMKKEGGKEISQQVSFSIPAATSSASQTSPNPAALPVSGTVHFIAHIDGRPVACTMSVPTSAGSVNVVTAVPRVAAVVDSEVVADQSEAFDDLMDPSIAFALTMGRSVPPSLLSAVTSLADEMEETLMYYQPTRAVYDKYWRSRVSQMSARIFLPNRDVLVQWQRYKLSLRARVFHPTRREWNTYHHDGYRQSRLCMRDRHRYHRRQHQAGVIGPLLRPSTAGWRSPDVPARRAGARRPPVRRYVKNIVSLDRLGSDIRPPAAPSWEASIGMKAPVGYLLALFVACLLLVFYSLLSGVLCGVQCLAWVSEYSVGWWVDACRSAVTVGLASVLPDSTARPRDFFRWLADVPLGDVIFPVPPDPDPGEGLFYFLRPLLRFFFPVATTCVSPASRTRRGDTIGGTSNHGQEVLSDKDKEPKVPRWVRRKTLRALRKVRQKGVKNEKSSIGKCKSPKCLVCSLKQASNIPMVSVVDAISGLDLAEDFTFLIDSGADVSLVTDPRLLTDFVARESAVLSANGSSMTITGLGELPFGLGPAHLTKDLATPVHAIISVKTLQHLGYNIYFSDNGEVRGTDPDGRIIFHSNSPIVSVKDFILNPTERVTLVISPISTVNSITTVKLPRVFPIGVPKEWRRAATNAADAAKRQSLVNYAHRRTHESVESMIKNAEAGMYEDLGITADHIRASPPICSSCATKKLIKRTPKKSLEPELAHSTVGDVISVDQFFMGKAWPKGRGDISSVFTTIDACSAFVHTFPIHGGASTWTSNWVIQHYKRLINIYKLWNHEIRVFRSDNDRVLVSKEVTNWAADLPIGLQHSASGEHNQNGLVERFHGYLRVWIETVYDDMDHLPLNLWYYVVLAGVHAWNVSFHASRPFTPWHYFYGLQYDYDSHPVIPIGTPVSYIATDGTRTQGMVIGVDFQAKESVKIFNPTTSGIIDTRQYAVLSEVPKDWPRRRAPFCIDPRSSQVIQEAPLFDTRYSHLATNDVEATSSETITPPLVQGVAPVSEGVGPVQSTASSHSIYAGGDELHDVLVQQLLDTRAPTYADSLFPGPFSPDALAPVSPDTLDGADDSLGDDYSLYHDPYLASFSDQLDQDNLLFSPVADRRSSVRYLDVSLTEGVEDIQGLAVDSVQETRVPEQEAKVEVLEEKRYATRSRQGKAPIVPVELLSRADAAQRKTNVLPSVLAVTATKRSPDEPTVSQALASAHKAQWEEAMQKEIMQIQGFGCVRFEDEGIADLSPCNDPPLPSHFVLKLKRRADFSIDKFKARLVVDGNRQNANQYKETAAPTGAMAIVLMAVALATSMGWHIASIDITGAFLHADIDCPIRVRIPSIDGTAPRIARLMKSVYGLKQAGRLFWNHLRENLLKFGFKEVPDTDCFYTYTASNGDQIWLLSHVDDLLLLTNNDSLLKMVHEFLCSVYHGATLETKLSSHLGLKFQRLQNGDMFVSQPGYVCHMLRTLNMEDCPPSSAPLSTNQPPENSPPVDITSYRQIIGLLNYLACHTRPDLLCPVSMLASHCCSPTEWHMQQAKQIVRYVKSTRELGVLFKRQHTQQLVLRASADGSFNNENDGRGRTGVCFAIGEGSGMFYSKSSRQVYVGLSSTESEIIALAECVKQVVYLRRILAYLGFIQPGPTPIQQDNLSAMALINDSSSGSFDRRRHIDPKLFYSRDEVMRESVCLNKTASAEMWSDLLTKNKTGAPMIHSRDHMLGIDYATAVALSSNPTVVTVNTVLSKGFFSG